MAKVVIRSGGKTLFSGEVDAPSVKVVDGKVEVSASAPAEKKEQV
jgi:hypothetical protein